MFSIIAVSCNVMMIDNKLKLKWIIAQLIQLITISQVTKFLGVQSTIHINSNIKLELLHLNRYVDILLIG